MRLLIAREGFRDAHLGIRKSTPMAPVPPALVWVVLYWRGAIGARAGREPAA